MSGNNTRKFRQYKKDIVYRQEQIDRVEYFRCLEMRDGYGIKQPTAYGASRGQPYISSSGIDLSRIPQKLKKGRKP